HEAACILNAGDTDAQIEITIYFRDREPLGPYRLTVPARRTFHMRFNDLTVPAPVPPGTDFSSLFVSDQAVVIQHTRLDSRSGPIALMSTVAYPVS
ncbi:MAG: sensory rhodopsin transducer, partial [Pseudomonadota bacterium]|nr:sensory rhodopsin transducer [Pseudomonadota bacterium]